MGDCRSSTLFCCRCLYASDHANNCVHRVGLHSSPDAKAPGVKWAVSRGPAGLSINAAANLLVASWGSNVVEEFTPSGQLSRRVGLAFEVWHAVELLNGGNLIVSHAGPVHGISEVTVDGQVGPTFRRQLC